MTHLTCNFCKTTSDLIQLRNGGTICQDCSDAIDIAHGLIVTEIDHSQSDDMRIVISFLDLDTGEITQCLGT
jgi:hypothetical protein